MSYYAVTFRIADKTVNGMTYDDRRKRLIGNVRTQGKGYWEETTSFFLVESDLSTSALAAKAGQGLSARDDLVVVFDPADMSCAYFGKLDHPDVLKSFFRSFRPALAA